MNHLDAALAARAHQSGRALRNSLFRHRRLVTDPLAIVIWQLGAEPFSAAAIAWGSRPDRFELAVPGEPRNRDLAFAATGKFARWFNPRFEAHAAHREPVTTGNYTFSRARTAPQVLVANAASTTMLARLGRRLAYLTAAGGKAPDPDLVQLGKHLLFLTDYSSMTGQQLLISITDLLNSHWASPLSPTERQSLAALDAYIDPPRGLHGFLAAANAEDLPAGPVPRAEDDERLDPLVDTFNERRAGSADPAIINPLLAPIENHYRKLTEPVWQLLWRCRDRELALPEAASVSRRWDDDRRSYTGHIDWQAKGGLRRTRHTPRRAAVTLHLLEDAKERTEAEEALDDSARMIPFLLNNMAVRGRVLAVNRNYKEQATKRMVRRPLVTLLSPDPCHMPLGKKLFWSKEPDGREFKIHAVERAGHDWRVTLKLMTSSLKTLLPGVGTDACFSIHTTKVHWAARLPITAPWTHQANLPTSVGPLDDEP